MDIRQKTEPAVWSALLISVAFFCVLLVNVIYWYATCESTKFFVFGFLACILLGIIIYAFKMNIIDRMTSEVVFLSALSISCIFFVFLFPPFSVPDEGHHFLSSYWLVDCITGESSLTDSSSIPLRQDDYLLCTEWASNEISLHSYQSILDHFELFNQNDEIEVIATEGFSVGSENIVTKIGSVLGIIIARILNLGAYPLFYLGRLLNAAQFVMLSYAAFKIIPTGKTIVASVSLLPMTLHLAASYSYDGGIIGLSMLLIALLLRAISNDKPFSIKEMISIGAVTALLAPCKILYTSITLLLFLIPKSRFRNVRDKYIFIISLILIAGVSIIGFRLAGIAGLASSSTELDYRGIESGHFYSLGDVINNPIGTIALFFRTLLVNGDFYASTLVGGSLGWFQDSIAAPYFIVFLYYLLLLIGAQKCRNDCDDVQLPTKVVMTSIFVLCIFGSMVSMFLGWTFTYEPIVMGVQGRYFLPVLIAALFAVRWKSVYINQPTYGLVLSGVCTLNIFYAVGLVGSALSLV
ncbi:DUF2142 domain-containing protein [Collinsella sp. An268]|uniref:DUF2142 domain-containing protein n=1 Tax=Collinsella sp. An268 TaxID=1965612 RepID=UPI001302D7C8|nr:DUF2142 domain-containing protein [Collinsella sp. An268]